MSLGTVSVLQPGATLKPVVHEDRSCSVRNASLDGLFGISVTHNMHHEKVSFASETSVM